MFWPFFLIPPMHKPRTSRYSNDEHKLLKDKQECWVGIICDYNIRTNRISFQRCETTIITLQSSNKRSKDIIYRQYIYWCCIVAISSKTGKFTGLIGCVVDVTDFLIFGWSMVDNDWCTSPSKQASE